jgi:lysozyme
MRDLIAVALILFLLASCGVPTERLEEYEVHGIDISHYQSRIDWKQVAEQGVHFAFVKASEGGTLQDSLFTLNWEGLGNSTIRRGAYHFFRPNVPVSQQVCNFTDVVQYQKGDLPPVLDVEVAGDVSREDLRQAILEWLSWVEVYYQTKPIVYTNLKFYRQHLAGYIDEYPIWIARYSYFTPRLHGGQDWLFWQYANQGSIVGIEGEVDLNVFNGTLEELEALCKQGSSLLSIHTIELRLNFPRTV